jgi:hypothetical protein
MEVGGRVVSVPTLVSYFLKVQNFFDLDAKLTHPFCQINILFSKISRLVQSTILFETLLNYHTVSINVSRPDPIFFPKVECGMWNPGPTDHVLVQRVEGLITAISHVLQRHAGFCESTHVSACTVERQDGFHIIPSFALVQRSLFVCLLAHHVSYFSQSSTHFSTKLLLQRRRESHRAVDDFEGDVGQVSVEHDLNDGL